MEQRHFMGGWPFDPVPRGARISAEEWARRQTALAQAPLFAALSKRQLRSLAKTTAVVAYKEGADVVKQGAVQSTFYVLLEGRAKVVRSGRTVAHLTPGDFFGEISVLDRGPRTASVVAETPLRCLSLAGGDLATFLQSDVPVALRILRQMASRLRDIERSPAS
jgi:CRP-like cAMP-binding protein